MVNLQVLGPDRSRVIDVVRPERLEMISDLRGEVAARAPVRRPPALVALLDEEPPAPPTSVPAREAGNPLTGPGGLPSKTSSGSATTASRSSAGATTR